MSYNFVDERNSDFLITHKIVYNEAELVKHIRKYGSLFSWILLSVNLLFLSILFFFLFSLIKWILVDVKQPNSLFVVAVSFVFLTILSYITFYLVKSFIFNLQWRKNITDKRIIDLLIEKGRITEGQVISIRANKIFYRFKPLNSSRIFQSIFETIRASEFAEGDKVAVLYLGGYVSVIL